MKKISSKNSNKIEIYGENNNKSQLKTHSNTMAAIIKAKIDIIKKNLDECEILRDEIRTSRAEKKPAVRKTDERKKSFLINKKDHYKKVLYEESGGISVSANAITKRMNEEWNKMTEEEKDQFNNVAKTGNDQKDEVIEDEDEFKVNVE